jgi:hypothetical protein
MPDVRGCKVSVNDQTRLHDAHFYGMTCTSITIRTTSSEFLEEQVRLIILTCIEQCDGLKYAMRQRVCEAAVTYLDQEQKMNGL